MDSKRYVYVNSSKGGFVAEVTAEHTDYGLIHVQGVYDPRRVGWLAVESTRPVQPEDWQEVSASDYKVARGCLKLDSQ